MVLEERLNLLVNLLVLVEILEAEKLLVEVSLKLPLGALLLLLKALLELPDPFIEFFQFP